MLFLLLCMRLLLGIVLLLTFYLPHQVAFFFFCRRCVWLGCICNYDTIL